MTGSHPHTGSSARSPPSHPHATAAFDREAFASAKRKLPRSRRGRHGTGDAARRWRCARRCPWAGLPGCNPRRGRADRSRSGSAERVKARRFAQGIPPRRWAYREGHLTSGRAATYSRSMSEIISPPEHPHSMSCVPRAVRTVATRPFIPVVRESAEDCAARPPDRWSTNRNLRFAVGRCTRLST